jgi:hypothetical protein
LVLSRTVLNWCLVWRSSLMLQCRWSRGLTCPLSSPRHFGCHHSSLLTHTKCIKRGRDWWHHPLLISWAPNILFPGGPFGDIPVSCFSYTGWSPHTTSIWLPSPVALDPWQLWSPGLSWLCSSCLHALLSLWLLPVLSPDPALWLLSPSLSLVSCCLAPYRVPGALNWQTAGRPLNPSVGILTVTVLVVQTVDFSDLTLTGVLGTC